MNRGAESGSGQKDAGQEDKHLHTRQTRWGGPGRERGRGRPWVAAHGRERRFGPCVCVCVRAQAYV
jgi:hypothetical protein